MDKPLIIAHRGSAGRYIENTIPAFEAAVTEGADMIELDVQLTAEGVPVVFHDPTLERICGIPGRISALSMKDIEKLKFADGLFIPSLEETLKQFSAKILFDIEIKNRDALIPTIKVIEKLDLVDRTCLSSFIEDTVLQARNSYPHIKTGLILGRRSMNPIIRFKEATIVPALFQTKASFAVCHHSLIKVLHVFFLSLLKVPLFIWLGLNEESDVNKKYFARCLYLGSEGIATIWPAECRTFIDAEQSP